MKKSEKPLVKFGGGTSNIELYEDYLVIKPSLLSKASVSTTSQKVIPLDSVVSVEIISKFMKTPYLQVITPGMVQDRKKDINRASEANVVLIQLGNMGKAKEIQEYVMRYKTGMGKVGGAQETKDEVEEIERLNNLMERGLITPEEFEAKKKKILGI